MKNLKFALVLLLTLSAGFFGCKKNDGDPEVEGTNTNVIKTPTGKSCLMNKIKDKSDNYSEVFEYDSQNRPVKVNFFEGTVPDGYCTITWSSSQVVVKVYSKTGQIEETNTYTASNGVVTGSSTTETWTNNGVTYKEVSQTTFEHNSEGFITKQSYTGTMTTIPATTTETYTGNTVYNYQNGNLLSEVETYGNQSETTTYEYYTDKANTIAPEDEGIILTKANKNPVKKRTTTNSQGSVSYTTDYTYTYNSDGLITKRIAAENSSTPGSIPYTYQNAFEYSCQ